MSPKTAVPADVPAAAPTPIVAPDKPISDWTDAEILAVYPKAPNRPIESYTTTELANLRNFGPAQVGGVLYLAAQKASNTTAQGVLGPAILSKGSTAVPFVSEAA